MRLRSITVTAIVVASFGLAACGSSGSASSSGGGATTSTSGTSTTSGGSSSGTPSTAGCPTAATVSTAMGSSFTGPVTGTNGGTAPCVYTGSSGDQVNVLFNAPGLSKSDFATQAQSDMGPTAAPVSGVGAAAYASTAFDHTEIEVWVSPSKSFSITIDNEDGTVHPENPAQAQAIAEAIVAA
jgi:hypothetical protein